MAQTTNPKIDENNLSRLLDTSCQIESEGRLEMQPKLLEDFEFVDRTYNIYEYLYNTAIVDLVLG